MGPLTSRGCSCLGLCSPLLYIHWRPPGAVCSTGSSVASSLGSFRGDIAQLDVAIGLDGRRFLGDLRREYLFRSIGRFAGSTPRASLMIQGCPRC